VGAARSDPSVTDWNRVLCAGQFGALVGNVLPLSSCALLFLGSLPIFLVAALLLLATDLSIGRGLPPLKNQQRSGHGSSSVRSTNFRSIQMLITCGRPVIRWQSRQWHAWTMSGLFVSVYRIFAHEHPPFKAIIHDFRTAPKAA
jgi:hypothetical protein